MFHSTKMFLLATLAVRVCCAAGLKGNPLIVPLLDLLNEPSGTQKLLMYLLDNLTCEYAFLWMASCWQISPKSLLWARTLVFCN